MSRKILAVRFDHGRGPARIRALSKSLRGTQFTLRGLEVLPGEGSKEALKSALPGAVDSLLAPPKEVS